MSGNSERQLQAIVDAVQDKEEEAGVMVRHIEGQKNSKWVLMDFGDVVVNAFLPEEREFYNLEKLWRDAPLVDVEGWIEG